MFAEARSGPVTHGMAIAAATALSQHWQQVGWQQEPKNEQQGRDLHQTTRCEAETEWRRTALREEAGEGETEALRPLTPLEADPVTVAPSA